MDEKKAAANGERCFSTRSGVCIGADDSQKSPGTGCHGRLSRSRRSRPRHGRAPVSSMIPMPESVFPVVPAQPDFPVLEHRVLDFWRERGTFEKLRAQNAEGAQA